MTALLKQGLERVFGPGANSTVFDSVTWADLGVMLGFVLLLVLFLNLVAAGKMSGRAKAYLRRMLMSGSNVYSSESKK